jgi:hypothetical protein
MSSTASRAEEFIALVESKGRRVYVSERLIDLQKLDQPNEIFVLELPDTSTAAGGRGGGFGERHVLKAFHYRCGKGYCMKVAEFDDAENLESLDLPYHATAFPIVMPDGKEKLVSGVADKELVFSYHEDLDT